MAITPDQLGVFKPKFNNDASTNGGIATLNQLSSGLRNSIFSDLANDSSLAGATEVRKVFIKQNLQAIDASAYGDASVFMKDIGDSDINFLLGYGAETDSGVNPTLDIMVGRVVNVGASYVDIETPLVKTGVITVTRFRPSTGSVVEVADASANASGNYCRLTNVQTSSFSVGDVITEKKVFELPLPDDKANLKPRVRDLNVSSAGTFNVSAVSFAPRAAVTGVVNLELISGSSYSWNIPDLNLNGVASLDEDLSVYHPETSAQTNAALVLKIPSSAFEGVWASGNTVNFTIVSGSIPLWLKRVVSDNPNVAGTQAVNFGVKYQTS